MDSTLSYRCPVCVNDTDGNFSHSFRKMRVIDGIHIFYSCPAEATKYNDHENILSHFRGMLEEIGNEPWKWVFNSKGFELKHAMEVKTAIRLARLISEIKADLQEVIIVNPTWHIHVTLKMITPFLKKGIRERIRMKAPNKKTK